MKVLVEGFEKETAQKLKEIAEEAGAEVEIRGGKNPRIRAKNVSWLGTPSGYETRAFSDSLKILKESKGFPSKGRARVLVFVTPMCPYCPSAVKTAVAYASKNPELEVLVVNALEERELAIAYQVSAVPHTVIEGKKVLAFVGAVPPAKFGEVLEEAVNG